MKEINGTDIPSDDIYQKLFVVEPAFSKYHPKEGLLALSGSEGEFLLNQIFNFELRHLAIIKPAQISGLNGRLVVSHHEICGGLLTFEKGRGDFDRVTCSGACMLNFEVNSLVGAPDMESYMLHLLMKQMVPNLPVANYIDCGDFTEGSPESEYGLLAVQCYALMRRGPAWQGVTRDMHYHLALTVKKGLSTKDDADGYDVWLRYLLRRMYARNKLIVQDILMPRLLGPFPRRPRS